ncbi:MAG: peptide-methionine (R)-S-oxide reductase MsrB [Fimbriimonadaceae bacterium]
MNVKAFIIVAFGLAAVAALIACAPRAALPQNPAPSGAKYPVQHTDAEWRKILSPAAYEVLRHADTERAFTSALLNEHRKGTFVCAGCGQKLFESSTKFDSGTGWPSFWTAIKGAVVERQDHSDGMDRTEVLCARCGGHLGHVFDDGPRPTGLRYCMNGVAMKFVPAKK